MSPSADVVEVAGGTVRGRVSDGVRRFLGIPYAAAPFGERRFQPPLPAVGWIGVREADRFGPTVPKGRMTPHLELMWPETWIEGEDCLNLNIWAPAEADGDAPVVVWIHGGGFTNGSGSTPELDGTAFARDGVICVTINYRLGADGFLTLGDGIANVGLLDQIAALEWVRENIAAFGGDPSRVTLAGHSAGGSSVACLLTCARADGLFSRAIVQSTSGISRLSSPEFSERIGRDLARRLGIAPERAAFAGVATGALVDAMAGQATDLRASGDTAMAPWAPTADGGLLPRDPLAAVVAGAGSRVPLLTGTTRDEMRVHRTGDELLESTEPDLVFRHPTIRLAEARAEASATSWVYRLDYPSPEDNGGYGAAHGVDVPLVFHTTDVASTRARLGDHPSRAVADLVHGTWVRFIHGDEPAWPAYDLETRVTGVLTNRIDPHAHLDPQLENHLISQHRDSGVPPIPET